MGVNTDSASLFQVLLPHFTSAPYTMVEILCGVPRHIYDGLDHTHVNTQQHSIISDAASHVRLGVLPLFTVG